MPRLASDCLMLFMLFTLLLCLHIRHGSAIFPPYYC